MVPFHPLRARLRQGAGRGLLAGVLVATLAGVTVPALAEERAGSAADKVPLTLTLSAREEGDGQFVTLLARLADPNGQPVGMQTVEFYLIPDFLGNSDRFNGRHPVRIGQAKTNATGTAKLRWQPAFSGPADLRAQVAGDDRFLPAQAGLTITLTRAGPVQPLLPRPLAAVRRPLGVAASGLVVGVWMLLGITTVATLRVLRQAGRKTRPSREQEHVVTREAPSAG